MAKNFITNSSQQLSLKDRIQTLIHMSNELKFLVGFFYFSGWETLYRSLKANTHVQLKLLIGLQVSPLFQKVVEHEALEEDGLSQEDQFSNFMSSLRHALNNEDMDTKAFYNQVRFFLQMLQEERLLIRKTENSNHAKLYLFNLNEEESHKQNLDGEFLTGSSNLTSAGLLGQEEFNVEIKDYGFRDAEAYFDELWQRAIPITEAPERRQQLIQFIEHESQAAAVTPFEAYALVLKSYLDLEERKQITPEVKGLLEEKGYKQYSYQMDAVNQALNIIDTYNGAIIADVVGLGKSIIASLIAKNLGQRGLVICPPGLMGDKMTGTGWWGYIQEFRLYDWEVASRGRIQELSENIDDKDFEVVIVDEAHRFRNEDTADYEALLNICRDKTVILLTATPFNNTPADIFSLLKLFLVPGQSGITLQDNLEGLFRSYNYRFARLNDILKNHNSKDENKAARAQKLYRELIEDHLPVKPKKVRDETQRLANSVKNIIAPVVIRRNRLDLKTDHQYSQEIDQLSEVQNPEELFYELDEQQSDFYDRVIDTYFGSEGKFNGAIYQPFTYQKVVEDPEELDEAGNRAYQQQRNLYEFMKRLLVKRFESSFGAFKASVDRFVRIHQVVQEFIEQSGGRYILDRKLMEDIYGESDDVIDKALHDFENDLLNRKTPKNNEVYNVHKFDDKDGFLRDIENDKALLEQIQQEVRDLDLVNNDPKREAVFQQINDILKKQEDPKRKVVIFSEYVATVEHLKDFLNEKLGGRLLVCAGNLTKNLQQSLLADFDAQHKHQTDHYDVLLTSDKLSEGVNLNRAGTIINYDIPWNPTQVIQRVGRINRIGIKVFDNLYIYNCFPTTRGADVVRSREIASQKMFLIHNSLGEDSKIFDAGEEPTEAGLFKRIKQNPYDGEEVNISTVVRNRFEAIKKDYPAVIERIDNLPQRVKTAKAYSENQLTVLRRKGLSLFSQVIREPNQAHEIEALPFEEYLPLIECSYETDHLSLSNDFWSAYETIKHYKPKFGTQRTEQSLEVKANSNLRLGQKLLKGQESGLREFMGTLLKDIRNYHTLSSRTLGRLGRKKLSEKSSEEEQKAFFDEVRWIQNQLGSDYLQKILKRVEGQQTEVIIAVENQNY